MIVMNQCYLPDVGGCFVVCRRMSLFVGNTKLFHGGEPCVNSYSMVQEKKFSVLYFQLRCKFEGEKGFREKNWYSILPGKRDEL